MARSSKNEMRTAKKTTPQTLREEDLAKVSGGVSFHYGQIKWVYTQQKRADGSGGNTTAK
ncbi:MAG TPA: hypothetical protein VLV17_03030 [Anaeromyxobacteraceae bacterium]|nr:hypothetical protein [Anaeromyxobacteraceae bacterium]